jgi:DNA transformation protein and related proteins
MAVSKDYLAYVVEQLERVTRVTTRRMFGGVGIYADALFFALIDDDTLYFKVDDTNRPDFEAVGMGPFRPFEDAQTMQYYEVPADVLEDRAVLGEWVGKAVAVARSRAAAKARAKSKPKTRGKTMTGARGNAGRSGDERARRRRGGSR